MAVAIIVRSRATRKITRYKADMIAIVLGILGYSDSSTGGPATGFSAVYDSSDEDTWPSTSVAEAE